MDDRYSGEIIKELKNINVALSDLKLIVENNTGIIKSHLEIEHGLKIGISERILSKEVIHKMEKPNIIKPVKRTRKKKNAITKTEKE